MAYSAVGTPDCKTVPKFVTQRRQRVTDLITDIAPEILTGNGYSFDCDWVREYLPFTSRQYQI